MDSRFLLSSIAVAVLLPAPTVIAAEYLTVESAQRAVFPRAERFAPTIVAPTPAQLQSIQEMAGPQPRRGRLQIWSAYRGASLIGYLFIDEVLGRQDLITYAIGIDVKGRLSTLEVLNYRESHGGEITNHNWRAQFNRDADLGQLRFRTDIKNIAGATLSSEHVTQGVRWLIALWRTTLRDSPAAAP